MPAHVPSLTTEADLLAAYLNQQLDGVRCAVFGLTEKQAHTAASASSLTLAGLLNHALQGTGAWLDRVAAAPEAPVVNRDEAASAWEGGFTPEASLDELVAAVETLKGRVVDLCARVDLNTPVPVPRDAPWWPQDVESWQVRWVLLHVIEEVARHAGHADIIRESIDGATMYELKAAVEEWPETEWLKRWRPKQ